MVELPILKQDRVDSLNFCEAIGDAMLEKDYQKAMNKLEEWYLRRQRQWVHALMKGDVEIFLRLHRLYEKTYDDLRFT